MMEQYAKPTIVETLRIAAEWFEMQGFAPTYISSIRNYGDKPEVCLVLNSRAEFRALALALGKAQKEFAGDYFTLSGDVGAFTITAIGARDAVCRRVVVGTKVIPAQPEQVVDEVEWVCDDPLLRATDTVAAA